MAGSPPAQLPEGGRRRHTNSKTVVDEPGVKRSWRTAKKCSCRASSTAVSRRPGIGSDAMPNDQHGELTIDVRQYGARGDGVRDDTDAIQQAFTAASQGHLGATVVLPPGAYKISGTLTLADATGLVVRGSGGRTRLEWAGDATAPLLQLASVQHSRFEDF